MERRARIVAGVLVASLATTLAACGGKQPQHQQQAPEVAVQTVDQGSVPLDLTYTAQKEKEPA